MEPLQQIRRPGRETLQGGGGHQSAPAPTATLIYSPGQEGGGRGHGAGHPWEEREPTSHTQHWGAARASTALRSLLCRGGWEEAPPCSGPQSRVSGAHSASGQQLFICQNSTHRKPVPLGPGSQALAVFLPRVVPRVPLPCSVLPMGTVPAELGFQLSCSTQELQCQGKRLHERPSHPARAGICSHCWPHAPAIHHHSVSPHVCTVSFSLLHPTAMTASRRGGCLKPHTSPAKAVPRLCSGQAAAANQSGTAGPTILGSGKGSSSLSAQP